MPFSAGFMVPHPPLAVHEVGRGDEMKIQATLDAFDTVAESSYASQSLSRILLF